MASLHFNPISAVDFLPLDQLQALQLSRLQTIVKRAYEQVGHYQKAFDEQAIAVAQIQSLEDIQQLPFTLKSDLRDQYPFGMFASPMKDIVRLHASSGTTGKPTVVGYTQADIELWTEVMARSLAACGVGGGDVIQNAYGYGLFTGGLGVHYGAETLGAAVIPISGGNTERQIMLLQDFRPTAITCTPSYFTFIIERAMELGVDFEKLPLRVGILGAEPWSEAMRRHIESCTGIKACNIYGLSEIIGPGVGMECEAQTGLHIFEDHFYPEVIDPNSGKRLPDGEYGELVLTTLTKWAQPMIRYRTRDVTQIQTTPCPCGRTLRQIGRIMSRTDDMLIVRGVNVFPSQIEATLLSVPETAPHYQILVTEQRGLTHLEVHVEAHPQAFRSDSKENEALEKKVAQVLQSALNIRVGVKVVAPNAIARSEGKAVRVVDQRKKPSGR